MKNTFRKFILDPALRLMLEIQKISQETKSRVTSRGQRKESESKED